MRRCAAVLMIKGEDFPCDWPVDPAGRHHGWAHASKAAEAIWCGYEGPSHRDSEPVERLEQIQGEVIS
jgi:hypothetical protein